MTDLITEPALDLRFRVEDFLHREARLLDQRRYAEWEQLWTDDGVYWVPVGPADYDPTRRVSLIYDERPALARRVARLCGDSAFAQIPPSTMVRIVSNIEIETRRTGALDVYSNFVLHAARRKIHDSFAGRVHHMLVPGEDTWRIARRTVELVGSTDPVPNLAFIV